MTKYEIGKPFPGAVPTTEGGTLEIERDGGLALYIQFPRMTKPEKMAFKDSFRDYWYFQPDMPVPIAYWIFGFGKPMNEVECNFNARICNKGNLDKALDTSEGLKNNLMIYLLDGKILQGIKMVGLANEAVELFHATIKAQLALDYTGQEYLHYLAAIEKYHVNELKLMANKFTKSS